MTIVFGTVFYDQAFEYLGGDFIDSTNSIIHIGFFMGIVGIESANYLFQNNVLHAKQLLEPNHSSRLNRIRFSPRSGSVQETQNNNLNNPRGKND